MIRRYIEGLQDRRNTLLQHAVGAVRLVIPSQLGDWFVRPQPAFSPAVEAAYARVPSEKDLREVWVEFRRDWCETGSLREFDPTRVGTPVGDPGQWAMLATKGEGLVINTLPDVWVAMSSDLLAQLMKEEREVQGRGEMSTETSLLYLASRLMQATDLESNHDELMRLDEFIAAGTLRVVKVSGARFNPRFMGWRVRERKTACRMIIHCALAYVRSQKAVTVPPDMQEASP